MLSRLYVVLKRDLCVLFSRYYICVVMKGLWKNRKILLRSKVFGTRFEASVTADKMKTLTTVLTCLEKRL
jgi:hypothetical protein